jgi:inorganic triphosphatase YgiF
MSEQPREVEGVLLVCADDQEAAGRKVAALERVDRFELRALPTRRIRDTYLDTGDGAVGAAGVALRVRELDGRALLTLKADAVRSGLAGERLELEAPWSAEALEAALEELRRRRVRLPDPPAAAGEPLADLGTIGLCPTQVRETTRTPREVRERGRDADPVAELTVDDVGYRLPAGTARLTEVEVEAKGSGGLETVQALLGALAEGFPGELRPWPYGKLATGRAVEQLLAAGHLEGLLGPDGRIRPAAHELLAELLSEAGA